MKHTLLIGVVIVGLLAGSAIAAPAAQPKPSCEMVWGNSKTFSENFDRVKEITAVPGHVGQYSLEKLGQLIAGGYLMQRCKERYANMIALYPETKTPMGLVTFLARRNGQLSRNGTFTNKTIPVTILDEIVRKGWYLYAPTDAQYRAAIANRQGEITTVTESLQQRALRGERGPAVVEELRRLDQAVQGTNGKLEGIARTLHKMFDKDGNFSKVALADIKRLTDEAKEEALQQWRTEREEDRQRILKLEEAQTALTDRMDGINTTVADQGKILEQHGGWLTEMRQAQTGFANLLHDYNAKLTSKVADLYYALVIVGVVVIVLAIMLLVSHRRQRNQAKDICALNKHVFGDPSSAEESMHGQLRKRMKDLEGRFSAKRCHSVDEFLGDAGNESLEGFIAAVPEGNQREQEAA